MPTMPRVKGKAKKIAFKILGTPPNLTYKRNMKKSTINKRLVFEETQRVR